MSGVMGTSMISPASLELIISLNVSDITAPFIKVVQITIAGLFDRGLKAIQGGIRSIEAAKVTPENSF